MRLNVKKAVNSFYAFFVMLFCCLMLFIMLPDQTSPVRARVEKIKGVPDTVQQFNKASIIGPGYIVINKPGKALRYFAPEASLDPFYLLLIFLLALVWLLFFTDFTYTKPFTKKAQTGVRVAFWLLCLSVFLNFWRQHWFNEQILKLTGNQYSYDRPMIIFSPEYLLGFLLLRAMWIYKRGMALESESELIV